MENSIRAVIIFVTISYFLSEIYSMTNPKCRQIDFNKTDSILELQPCFTVAPMFTLSSYSNNSLPPFGDEYVNYLTNIEAGLTCNSVGVFTVNEFTRFYAGIFLQSIIVGDPSYVELQLHDVDTAAVYQITTVVPGFSGWTEMYYEWDRYIENAKVGIYAFLSIDAEMAIQYIHITNLAVAEFDCRRATTTKTPETTTDTTTTLETTTDTTTTPETTTDTTTTPETTTDTTTTPETTTDTTTTPETTTDTTTMLETTTDTTTTAEITTDTTTTPETTTYTTTMLETTTDTTTTPEITTDTTTTPETTTDTTATLETTTDTVTTPETTTDTTTTPETTTDTTTTLKTTTDTTTTPETTRNTTTTPETTSTPEVDLPTCLTVDFNNLTSLHDTFNECYGQYLPEFIIKSYLNTTITPYRDTSLFHLSNKWEGLSCLETTSIFSLNEANFVESVVFLDGVWPGAWLEISIADVLTGQREVLEKLQTDKNWVRLTAEIKGNYRNAKIFIKTNMNSYSQLAMEYFNVRGNPRNKCALKPGHSLMDWIRLGSSGCDLAGTGGIISAVSHSELAKHCKCDDAWLAIRGKVYNVTRYMDFHPGGTDELMKGVGKDATKIFDEVHAWVNYEQLLGKCYVGPLRNIATISIGDEKTVTDNPSSTTTDQFKTPPLPLKPADATSQSIEVIPRFDWIQKTADLTVIFYTKSMCNPGFSIECMSECEVVVRIFIDRTMHFCSFRFANPVIWPCSIKVANETGKIELNFAKATPALWTNFGLLDRRKTTELTNCFVEYDVITRVQISHDSYAIIIKPKQNIVQHFPIGYHINVTAKIQGLETVRSYTPVPSPYLPIPCPSSCVPLLVKSYSSGTLSKFLTTSHPLANSFFISYPKGNFVLQQLSNYNHFAILAAGSGITPMLGLLDYLLERTSNKVETINLCYFNKVEENIWCRQRLELLAKRNERFKITHILSEPSPSWSGQTGHITADIIKTFIDPSSANVSTFCCVCGPQPFNELAVEFLESAGFQSNDLHIFHG